MNKPQKSKIITEAAVQTIDSQSVRICWETSCDAEVAVYAGKSPDNFDRDMAPAVSEDGCVLVEGLDPSERYYFVLEAQGDTLVTAERRVCMDGAVNFRDLGGYETSDGRRVKWGSAFRSDGLARLSAMDIKRLKHIGIRRVYDFRTASEMEGAPDRLPEDGSVDHINLAVSHGRFDFADAVKRLKNGDHSWLTPDFMVNGYIGNLEQYAHCWAEVIRDLARHGNSPILFHCTGGKDRAGTCAALVLLALGVPEEQVIDDHQLSNIYIARLLPRLYRQMEDAGINPDALFPFLTAPRECIVAVMDYIAGRYGTAGNYLVKKAGLSHGELRQLKHNMVE